ncbi:CsbD family protein [Aquabacter sp. L1I39]|uniref:CsbD family protein n=1 Tax=Aquabacter sp. L1I39 TaxID=2820278 RepID=UPI001ADD25C7|nr:CsbD family protein [Aquabacter sp. L1I39]QTL02363.1 CsbD family protein [Aquabacter sp. L1I39]
MNWDRIEGNWKQFSGSVKTQWGKLTDDDMAQINGNREKLEGKLQERYGLAKDQVKEQVDTWSRGVDRM